MMQYCNDPFLQFVRAVRRRMRVVRAAEGMGMGVVAGAVVGLLLMGLLIWRGDTAVMVGVWVMMLGGVMGALWGAMRGPELMAAATEADRQLKLKDLLGTALAARDAQDPWTRTVRAIADDCCASLHPRQVVLNRLGARAWGGIVTAALLALSAAILAPSATPSFADGVQPTFISADDIDRLAQAPSRPVLPQQRSNPPRRRAPDRPSAIPMGTDDPTDARANDTAVESPHQSDIANPQGAGGGEGRSETRVDPERLGISPSDDPAAAEDGDSAGGGAAGRAGASGDERHSGTQAASDSAGPVPPWGSDNWGATRDAVTDAIERNEIPGEYRDLVRGYFLREPEAR